MKRINADSSFLKLGLFLFLLAALFGCANTRPASLHYIQQDVSDVVIELPKDGMNQKQFDQKIAEIGIKSKGFPQILDAADSLFDEQAKYCDKRNDVEFFSAGLLFSTSLLGHYLWYRSINERNKDVTEQGGMAAGIEGGILGTSFIVTLPLEFILFPKLASRALVGPKVKPKLENRLRELVRTHNRSVADKKDSVQNK
jgi:hypothetical protein